MPEINFQELPKIEIKPQSRLEETRSQTPETETSKILTIAEFKEKLESTSSEVAVKKEEKRSVLIDFYKEGSEKTKKFSIETFGDYSKNLQEHCERKTQFQETIDRLPFFKKLRLKNQRSQVIKDLKKNGIQDADVMVKSLEENASHYIFHRDPDKPKNSYISYDSIISYGKKGEEPIDVIKSISQIYNRDNYDIFRKLELFYPYLSNKSTPDDYYLLTRSVRPFIKLSPDKFDDFLTTKEQYPSINLNDNNDIFAKKIELGTFSQSDLDRLDCITKHGQFLISTNPETPTEILKTNLKMYESAFIQSQHSRYGNSEARNIMHSIIESYDDSNKVILYSLVNSGIEINLDYGNRHSGLNLNSDMQTVFSCLNSPDGKYLESAISSLVNPNLKTITLLIENIDFIKSANGPKLIKTLNLIDIPGFQEYVILMKENINSFFDDSNLPTDEFIFKCFSVGSKTKDILNPEYLINLNEKDRRFWNLQREITFDKFHNYSGISNILLSNKGNIDDLFDQNNQPKIKFIEECINIKEQNPDNIKSLNNYLISILTPECIENLESPDDKKLLNVFKNIIDVADQKTYRYIFENKDKINLFFDDNNRSTSKFYEEFFSQNPIDHFDKTFSHMSNSKDIELFSEEDQKFWNFVLEDLKNQPIDILQMAVKNKADFFEKSYKDGKFTKHFFIVLKKTAPVNLKNIF